MSIKENAPLAGKGEFGKSTLSTLANCTSNLDLLLSQLRKVKRTGHGNYIACCPSHNDKNPSLAIRDDEGKILLRCFSGCSAYEVVSAVGLELSDLFPPRESDYSKPIKNPFPATNVIRCLQFEALIVVTAACNIANGIELSNEDLRRLVVAASRIGACYE